MSGDPHVCCYCNERQVKNVIFEAVHPYATITYPIEYCKHLNVLLTDEVKCVIDKLECPFPQRVRNGKLYGR